MPTSSTYFSPGYRGSKGKGKKRRGARSGNSVAMHEGRLPQPGVPTGPRNQAATDTARSHRPPPTSALDIPTNVRRMHEGRTDLPGVPGKREFGTPVSALAPLELAIRRAAFEGVKPDYPAIRHTYGPKAADLAEEAYIKHIAGEENLGEPGDLTDAILLATGIGGAIRSAGSLIGKAGLRAATEEAGAKAAAAGAADVSSQGGIRQALRTLAAKAEPEAVQAARQTAKQAVEKVPKGVRTAAKTAARAGSYPVRHPVKSPLAVQAIPAALHKDPGELTGALTGDGIYADAFNTVAQQAPGVLGEAVSLPALALPSVFLAGKAGYAAAQGHPDELEELWDEYQRTGVLPQLLQGQLSEALKNLGAHPLYGGLELSGAASAAGRGLGALAREGTGGRVGGQARPDLTVKGTNVRVARRYSPDLFRQLGERASDRGAFRWLNATKDNEVAPGSRRAARTLKRDKQRFSSDAEAVRRLHRREEQEFLRKVLPGIGKTVRGPFAPGEGRTFGKLDRASAEVVHLAVERIAQRPSTFHSDLEHYRDMLDEIAERRGEHGRPVLDREEMAANRDLRRQIDAALDLSPKRVAATVDAANAFIRHQREITREWEELGLLERDQGKRAAAMSFATVHRGGRRVGDGPMLDREGNPIDLRDLYDEMVRQGIEPGFLSHRQPGPSDYYPGSSYGGAQAPKGQRTGASVERGTQLWSMSGIEALERQLLRGRGLVDKARTWNAAVTRFGLSVNGMRTWADAKRVLRDPARHGIDPGLDPVAVPVHPFTAKAVEREAARRHQDPAVAEHPDVTDEAADSLLARGLQRGIDGELPDDAEVVLMPRAIAEEFVAEATPRGQGARILDAYTQRVKRTWLPFSPHWVLANAADNWLRAALEGSLNPIHGIVGLKTARAMSPEARERGLAGAHMSSVDRTAAHRSAEQMLRGQDKLQRSLLSIAKASRKPNAKGRALRALPAAINGATEMSLAFNRYVTERLPQYGSLGKLVLRDAHDMRGSWLKTIGHLDGIAEDLARGVEADPARMNQLVRDLQETYGNYVDMNVNSRRFWSTAVPFWTWLRSATKFVFLTMPAHHPIKSALITAAAQAEAKRLEAWGLNPEGEKPVERYLTGGLPESGGAIRRAGDLTSFGFVGEAAADPGVIGRQAVPQFSGPVFQLLGLNPFGEPADTSRGERASGALLEFVTNVTPGSPLWLDTTEGGPPKVKSPVEAVSPPALKRYDAEKVNQARVRRQYISVPKEGESTGSSSAGGIDYGAVFSGQSAGGSGIDYGAVFSGR